ncbi:hypothetical protein WM40_12350 [Robbsia andropogonis]|uniref:Type III secretion protein HrpB7 n=1 Tax=Robbsia andropogonis TaxID=28092 RepID=A0A0F5K041_9BURK|nr:hypothetical protein [Robbsia andropogonis]KKB63290.1 hypothetical protein WM40_12350 [Robbsia andropogonis]MCP1118210.1 hypothetical protein [Robbsia andropogonis]MCP1127509.1 hypothetical protein [Robbsia andropogonis]
MTALAIRQWRIIVSVKTRHCERCEADVTRERKALVERQSRLAEAMHAVTVAEKKCVEHEARIVALIDGATHVVTSDYLAHDAWRAPLKDVLMAERNAEKKCRAAVTHQQQRLADAQAALARAQSALDQCRRKLDKLLKRAAVAVELATDEEAAENLLARRHAR